METGTMIPDETTYTRHGARGVGSAQSDKRNVNSTERVASAVLGTMAIASGLRRRDVGGTILALLGGELVYRGVTGRCPVYRAAGLSTAGATSRNAELHWKPEGSEERPSQKLHWRSIPEGRCQGSLRLRETDDRSATDLDLHVRLRPREGSLWAGILNALHFIPLVVSSKAFQRFHGVGALE